MTPRLVVLILLASTLGSGMCSSTARADWLVNGNPVCTAAGRQFDASAIPDDAGGVIFVWRDQRRGALLTDLYASRLLPDGSRAPGWPENGALVAATGLAGYPFAAEDGAGGLFVAWFDQSTHQGRLQHLDGSGAVVAGFAANGNLLPVAVGGPGGYHVRLEPDGAGGLYLLWNEYNGSLDAARVTRLTNTGAIAPGWSAAGVIVGGSIFAIGWGLLDIAYDPTGGVIFTQEVIVEDEPSGSSSIGSVRRVSAAGAITLSVMVDPNGHTGQPGSHFTVGGLLALPDGAGGAFAAWRIGTESGSVRHGQHYLANGTASWPFGTQLPVIDRIFPDGADGFYALGLLLDSASLELHRRAADGSSPAGWAAGVPVATSSTYNGLLGARSASQAFAAWSGGPGGSEDVLASAFTSAGQLAPGWTAGGTSVCDATGTQQLIALVPGLTGDVYAGWLDRRGADEDVYALRMLAGGPAYLDAPAPRAGSRLLLDFPSPNPARDRVQCTLTLPEPGPASLELLDLSGRLVRATSLSTSAGRQSSSLSTQGLPDGLYFVRLRQGGLSAVRRVSLVR